MDTLSQEPDMTEHGDDILIVSPEEGLFLFVHDNILKSDTIAIEEIVNFFIESNSSKEDVLTFMHYNSVLRMRPSMKMLQ